MAAEPPGGTDEDFTSPHLPERYQSAVRAKRRRRIRRNALIAVAVLGVIAVLVVVSGVFSGPAPLLSFLHSGQGSGTGPEGAEANVTPAAETGGMSSVRQGPGLSGTLPAGTVAPGQALERIRADYPEPVYSVLSADFITGRGRPLYEFTIRDTSGSGPALTAWIDAASGNPYSPGEENAAIPRDAARSRALGANPGITADRVILDYSGSADTGQAWTYAIYTGNRKAAVGTIDAVTGEQKAFARFPAPEGRPAAASVSATRARSLAEHYIADHNGGQLPLNMTAVQYSPIAGGSGTVAGQYTFRFERLYLDYPTDADGFLVTVDAVTGDVTGYSGQWTTPDYAFSAAYEPDVVKREATFAVMQRAKAEYPDAVSGLRIISAELRWKNRVPYGTVPRPGTIPLGWKVVFDDDVIRANTSATAGVAWIDVQSGAFMSFDYQH